jgi:hypothetical protein
MRKTLMITNLENINTKRNKKLMPTNAMGKLKIRQLGAKGLTTRSDRIKWKPEPLKKRGETEKPNE